MSDQLTVLSSAIPQLYYDSESSLVDILEEYYRWLDQQFINPSDIRTADAEQEFVDRLLEDYAPGIEKTDQTNQRLLIKYATELFRAKGTPRAIDLFFRLVFHVNSSVGFPRERLFKTSDAEFTRPQFIEITRSDHVNKFIYQYAITSSKASFFVEGVHRIGNRVILLISNIEGTLRIGDAIFTTTDTRVDASTIVGSLSQIDVQTSLDGFAKGEEVKFVNGSGAVGYGYVAEVGTGGLEATFSLESQGIGISPNPEINISTQTLRATDISSTGGELFAEGASVTQELFTATFDELGGEFAAGETVQLEEYTGETLIGSVDATIVAFEQTVDAGGRVVIQSSAPQANVLAASYVVNGDNYGNNAIIAVADATGSVVAPSRESTAVFTTNDRPFAIGDQVFQYIGGDVAEGVIVDTPSAQQATIKIESGQFVPGVSINNQANNAIFTPTDIETFVGVNQLTGKFYPQGEASCGNTTFTVGEASSVTSSSLSVSKLDRSEITIVPSFNDPTYLSVDGSQYLTSDGVDYYAIPTGTVAELQTNYTGDGYDHPPIATIKQPSITARAFKLTVDTAEDFEIGERVFQTGVEHKSYDVTVADASVFYKGQVVGRISSVPGIGVVDYVDRENNKIGIRLAEGLWTHANSIREFSNGAIGDLLSDITALAGSTTVKVAKGIVVRKTADTITVVTSEEFVTGGTLTGESSGAARSTTVTEDVTDEFPPLNEARVNATLSRIRGKVASVTVVSSLPGFTQGETVDIVINDSVVGTGSVRLGPVGQLHPRFTKLGSRPSSGHSLFDGRYFQHLSYEVKTPIDMDKYPNNKQFLQLAGMEMFINNELAASNSAAEQSVNAEVSITDV